MQSVWKIGSAEMRSMENADCVENKECGKCRVWKMQSVWKIRSMENEEYVENKECGNAEYGK